METVLILSAFPDEQRHYLEHFDILETTTIAFVKTHICNANNKKVYLATTGMGTINAALVLATLSAQVPFDRIYFSGTCGGINTHLNKGDVVIATETFDADILSIHEAVRNTPFEAALINPHNQQKTLRSFPANPTLLQASKNLTCHFNVFHGPIATSNHFPSPIELFNKIKSHNALAIDMESAAVYQFAWLSHIPCLVVRGVSNTLDEDGGDDDVKESDVSASDHAAMVVLQCITTPTHFSVHEFHE